MPGHERAVILPPDLAEYVEELVASGAYASAEAAVRAGLVALQLHDLPAGDPDVEAWLVREVVPAYDAFMGDTSRGISADEVLDGLRRRAENS